MILTEQWIVKAVWAGAFLVWAAVQSAGQQSIATSRGQDMGPGNTLLVRGGDSGQQPDRDVPARAEDRRQTSEPARLGSRPAANDEVRVFRLEHARPHAVADVVHELNKALPVAVDARLNAVIVRDPTGERYMGVVERVISELDRPSEPEGSAVTEFVRLEHRDAEDVVRVLSRSIGRIGLQMGHDSANQLVLLTGPRADVQEMRELIGEMDQPKKPVRLSFFFLKGRGGETTFPAVAEERISELPEGLRPVGRSLQNGGFAQPRLLAPLTANAMENASFQTGGFISTGEHMAGLDIDVEGRVRQGTRAGTARIEIKAEVVRAARNPREEGGVARYPIFSVHTTLVAKFGDHVVLAAAPSSGEDGSDFLALVVRMDQGS